MSLTAASMSLSQCGPSRPLCHRPQWSVTPARIAPTFRSIRRFSKKPERFQEGFERDERPPPENVGNAAKEISRERSAAGAQEADINPKGGSGMEPAPADGEGQGYSMKQVAEETTGDKMKEKKEGAAGEEAGVQDIE